MKMSTRYDVNGKVAMNMKEVAELLGRTVTKKDVLAGKVEGVIAYEVDEDAVNDTPTGEGISEEEQAAIDAANDVLDGPADIEGDTEGNADATEESTDTQGDTDTNTDEDTDSGDTQDDTDVDTDNTGASTDRMAELRAKLKAINEKAKTEGTAATGTGKGKDGKGTTEEIEYPEKGTFKTEKELKKFYKKLSDTQLDEWLELEGIKDKVKLCDHEAINRMRKCMAIMDLHFPKAATSAKKKSKYADLSTEELVELAINNDIVVKDDKGDPRILRMYTIMALREAGILS